MSFRVKQRNLVQTTDSNTDTASDTVETDGPLLAWMETAHVKCQLAVNEDPNVVIPTKREGLPALVLEEVPDLGGEPEVVQFAVVDATVGPSLVFTEIARRIPTLPIERIEPHLAGVEHVRAVGLPRKRQRTDDGIGHVSNVAVPLTEVLHRRQLLTLGAIGRYFILWKIRVATTRVEFGLTFGVESGFDEIERHVATVHGGFEIWMARIGVRIDWLRQQIAVRHLEDEVFGRCSRIISASPSRLDAATRGTAITIHFVTVITGFGSQLEPVPATIDAAARAAIGLEFTLCGAAITANLIGIVA